jgi:hypothetical protein
VYHIRRQFPLALSGQRVEVVVLLPRVVVVHRPGVDQFGKLLLRHLVPACQLGRLGRVLSLRRVVRGWLLFRLLRQPSLDRVLTNLHCQLLEGRLRLLHLLLQQPVLVLLDLPSLDVLGRLLRTSRRQD